MQVNLSRRSAGLAAARPGRQGLETYGTKELRTKN